MHEISRPKSKALETDSMLTHDVVVRIRARTALFAIIPALLGWMIGFTAHMIFLGTDHIWIMAVTGIAALMIALGGWLSYRDSDVRVGQWVSLTFYIFLTYFLIATTGGISSQLLVLILMPMTFVLTMRNIRIVFSVAVLNVVFIVVLAVLGSRGFLQSAYFANPEFRQQAPAVATVEVIIILSFMGYLLLREHQQIAEAVRQIHTMRLQAVTRAERASRELEELGGLMQQVLAQSNLAVADITTGGTNQQLIGNRSIAESPIGKVVSNTPADDIPVLSHHLEAAGLEVIERVSQRPGQTLLEVTNESDYWTLEVLRLGDGGGALLLSDVTQSREAERIRAQQVRLESLGVLTAGVAHDFNNLLMVMQANLELLEFQGPTAQTLTRSQEAIDRAKRLVDQLTDFARPRSMSGSIDQAAALRRIHELVPNLLGPRYRVSLEIQSDGHVGGDLASLETSLINLLVNASEAMPEGGEITMRSRWASAEETARLMLDPQEYLAIEVLDDGPGIDAEKRERIFEPFFSTKRENSGLGLAMTHGFARSAMGAVACQPSSKGGHFTIYLPVVEPQVDTAANDEGSTRDFQGARILLIEDNEMLLDVLAEMLSSFEPALVKARSCADVRNLMSSDKQEPFDYIVSDLHLGDGTVSQLFDIFKAHSPDAGIMVMSGNPDLSHGQRAIFDGIPILMKPFATPELIAALASSGADPSNS